MISFSTQPGNVALDGTGRNSPYAAALLKHLATPGEDLPTILINVRNDVMKATGRRQVPWEHSAMTAKFYFTPPKEGPQEVELQFWASVKDSASPGVLRTYVERFPDGEFVPIARALIEHYEQRSKAEEAAREEAVRRREEERKAAEVKGSRKTDGRRMRHSPRRSASRTTTEAALKRSSPRTKGTQSNWRIPRSCARRWRRCASRARQRPRPSRSGSQPLKLRRMQPRQQKKRSRPSGRPKRAMTRRSLQRCRNWMSHRRAT